VTPPLRQQHKTGWAEPEENTNIVEEHVMDIFKKNMQEDSVEDIGAIVDFEEDEDESDPEACDIVNSLNHVINIQISQAGLVNESNRDQTYQKVEHKQQTNVYNDVNTSDKKDKTNISNKSISNTHMYENDHDRYGYENVKQYSEEENEYEEIHFENNTPSKLLNTEDNYINLSLLSNLNLSKNEPEYSVEQFYQSGNVLTKNKVSKDIQTGRRRWSTCGEDNSQPLQIEQRRWSLKNTPTIKSILKRNKQTDKNIQSVNFRANGNFFRMKSINSSKTVFKQK